MPTPKVPEANYFLVRGLVFTLYVVVSLYFAIRVRRCVSKCDDRHDIAITIAQCFAWITVPISIFHSWEHLTNFVKPKLQSQIVRMIWMVPVFSLECMLSIQYVESAFYFQAFREIYEAYVIYCFMRYLLHFLGEDRKLADRLAMMPAYMGYHKPPFCWLPPWQMGAEFLRRCKAGVFQYVIVRFALTVFALLLNIIGCYDEGNYSLSSPYFWVTFIECCSQTWALYALFLFYHCTHKELITMRPFAKFLCVKMVIFFSWWQALAIAALVRLGHISEGHGHSAQQVANLIQDLLICMEMLVAAIAFFNSFPVTEFANVYQLGYPSFGVGNTAAASLAMPVTTIGGSSQQQRPQGSSSKSSSSGNSGRAAAAAAASSSATAAGVTGGVGGSFNNELTSSSSRGILASFLPCVVPSETTGAVAAGAASPAITTKGQGRAAPVQTSSPTISRVPIYAAAASDYATDYTACEPPPTATSFLRQDVSPMKPAAAGMIGLSSLVTLREAGRSALGALAPVLSLAPAVLESSVVSGGVNLSHAFAHTLSGSSSSSTGTGGENTTTPGKSRNIQTRTGGLYRKNSFDMGDYGGLSAMDKYSPGAEDIINNMSEEKQPLLSSRNTSSGSFGNGGSGHWGSTGTASRKQVGVSNNNSSSISSPYRSSHTIQSTGTGRLREPLLANSVFLGDDEQPSSFYGNNGARSGATQVASGFGVDIGTDMNSNRTRQTSDSSHPITSIPVRGTVDQATGSKLSPPARRPSTQRPPSGDFAAAVGSRATNNRYQHSNNTSTTTTGTAGGFEQHHQQAPLLVANNNTMATPSIKRGAHSRSYSTGAFKQGGGGGYRGTNVINEGAGGGAADASSTDPLDDGGLSVVCYDGDVYNFGVARAHSSVESYATTGTGTHSSVGPAPVASTSLPTRKSVVVSAVAGNGPTTPLAISSSSRPGSKEVMLPSNLRTTAANNTGSSTNAGSSSASAPTYRGAATATATYILPAPSRGFLATNNNRIINNNSNVDADIGNGNSSTTGPRERTFSNQFSTSSGGDFPVFGIAGTVTGTGNNSAVSPGGVTIAAQQSGQQQYSSTSDGESSPWATAIDRSQQRQRTFMQALWLTVVPGDLQEDLSDLTSHVSENYVSQPYVQVRRWIKGTAAHS